MKIEQYLSGRKKFDGYPVGSNGDEKSGFGCYCRTDHVQQSDRSDLDGYFNYYVSRERTKDGSLPTIYSKTRLQSGNTALTAQTYIATDVRPNVVSHSYIVPALHRQTVDPESWFNLPFFQTDLNAATPEEEQRRQREGRQIVLTAQNTLPESGFQLKPLKAVLQRWNLQDNKPNILRILTGAVDSARLQNHELFIAYDINRTTLDDMQQLLAWIYLMLPYSYRRVIGFDTLYNDASMAHQIIFISSTQIIDGGEIRLRSWKSNGTDVSQTLNYLEHGYLYDWRSGTITHESTKREIYNTDTPMVRFFVDEIKKLSDLDSIEQCRKVMREYDELFRELDEKIDPFTTSAEVYDSEIYFRAGLETGRWDELQDAADETLNAADLIASTERQNRLRTVADVMYSRAKKEADGQIVWGNFVYRAIMRSEFPQQKRFVKKYADVILEQPRENWMDLFESSRNKLAGNTIENTETAELLQVNLLQNQEFQREFIHARFAKLSTWQARAKESIALMQYIDAKLNEQSESVKYILTNEVWSKQLEPSDTDSFCYLLMRKAENDTNIVCDMADTGLALFADNLRRTDAYRTISTDGIYAYLSFKEKSQNSMYIKYEDILSVFYEEAVLQKWLPNAGDVLANNIQQIFALIKEDLRWQYSGRVPIEECILRAVANYINWKFIEDFRAKSENKSQIDPQVLQNLRKNFYSQMLINAKQHAAVGILSAEELAEAITVQTQIRGVYPNEAETQELLQAVRRKQNVTFTYLIKFTERLYYISKNNRETVKNGFETVHTLAEHIIEQLQQNSIHREVLYDFNQLVKMWEGEAYAYSFHELRRKLTRNMDIYPDMNLFAAFLEQPDEASVEELENFGFEHLNCYGNRETSVAVLAEALKKSPVKKLRELFEEAVSSKGKQKPEWLDVYDMVCKGLLEKGLVAEKSDRLNRTWFEEQELSQLNSLSKAGNYAKALMKLCMIYQDKNTAKDIEIPEVTETLKQYYQRGQIQLDSSSCRKILKTKFGMEFAEYMIKLENPEKIAEICRYLKRNKDNAALNMLENAVQKYKIFLQPAEDYSLIMEQFADRDAMHAVHKKKRPRSSFGNFVKSEMKKMMTGEPEEQENSSKKKKYKKNRK